MLFYSSTFLRFAYSELLLVTPDVGRHWLTDWLTGKRTVWESLLSRVSPNWQIFSSSSSLAIYQNLATFGLTTIINRCLRRFHLFLKEGAQSFMQICFVVLLFLWFLIRSLLVGYDGQQWEGVFTKLVCGLIGWRSPFKCWSFKYLGIIGQLLLSMYQNKCFPVCHH